jgi:hypothetical protein
MRNSTLLPSLMRMALTSASTRRRTSLTVSGTKKYSTSYLGTRASRYSAQHMARLALQYVGTHGEVNHMSGDPANAYKRGQGSEFMN